jgi:hypothetical protein
MRPLLSRAAAYPGEEDVQLIAVERGAHHWNRELGTPQAPAETTLLVQSDEAYEAFARRAVCRARALANSGRRLRLVTLLVSSLPHAAGHAVRAGFARALFGTIPDAAPCELVLIAPADTESAARSELFELVETLISEVPERQLSIRLRFSGALENHAPKVSGAPGAHGAVPFNAIQRCAAAAE